MLTLKIIPKPEPESLKRYLKTIAGLPEVSDFIPSVMSTTSISRISFTYIANLQSLLDEKIKCDLVPQAENELIVLHGSVPHSVL